MKFSAHAYVVRGPSKAVSFVEKMLQEQGIETKANPDVFSRVYSNFTIDDARTLRERAALRAVGTVGRIFIIAAPTIPAEAQNALLKTFEEPPAGARFFLVVPSPESLLPTLRSRVQILDIALQAQEGLVDAEQFLKAQPEKRIQMLGPLLEKGDDDKRDLGGILAFLSELERLLGQKSQESTVGLKSVYLARKYITDRGALSKALLEQTALLVPRL